MSSEIPAEYRGREQTWFKHGILAQYISMWAHKLGSIAVGWRGKPLKIWYCDVFSGPWNSRDADFADTSIRIGLDALVEARATMAARGASLEIGAFFVERDARAYQALQAATSQFRDVGVDVQLRNGEFRDYVDEIDQTLGDDPAFLLVDPTGWKDVTMDCIARLVRDRRDVMVRVPFHLYRFKGRDAEILRAQIAEFMGMTAEEAAAARDEEEFIRLYTTRFKEVCGFRYAAELAIPSATRSLTSFWLTVGGGHPQVLNVFRDAEAQIVGKIAGRVRDGIKRERETPGQMPLFDASGDDPSYQQVRARCAWEVPQSVLAALREAGGALPYSSLWPAILEANHLRKADLDEILRQMIADNKIEIPQLRGRQRRPADGYEIRLAAEAAGEEAR